MVARTGQNHGPRTAFAASDDNAHGHIHVEMLQMLISMPTDRQTSTMARGIEGCPASEGVWRKHFDLAACRHRLYSDSADCIGQIPMFGGVPQSCSQT